SYNCTIRIAVCRLVLPRASRDLDPRRGRQMAYKETFWMACDSTEQLRAEFGPFHTRVEAESEARKLGFGYLLRYEHMIGPNEEIEEVRCIFVELAESQLSQTVPPV